MDNHINYEQDVTNNLVDACRLFVSIFPDIKIKFTKAKDEHSYDNTFSNLCSDFFIELFLPSFVHISSAIVGYGYNINEKNKNITWNNSGVYGFYKSAKNIYKLRSPGKQFINLITNIPANTVYLLTALLQSTIALFIIIGSGICLSITKICNKLEKMLNKDIEYAIMPNSIF